MFQVYPSRLTQTTFARSIMLILISLLMVCSLPAGEVLAAPNVEQVQNFTLAQTTEQLNSSISFIPNRGQTDSSVKFTTRAGNSTVFFTSNEVVFALLPPEFEEARQEGNGSKDLTRLQRIKDALKLPSTSARMRFDRANFEPKLVGLERGVEQVNFFFSSNDATWQTDIETYSSIVYAQLYPGISLRYDSSEQLKSTYVVSPGADPTQIAWHYEGVDGVRIEKGDLIIDLAPPPGREREDRSLIEQAPIAWQEIDGQRAPVAVEYTLIDNSISFSIGQYDSRYELLIDPILTHSTYLGGNSTDEINSIAVDSSQNIYVAGITYSSNFPTLNPRDSSYNNGGDVFVTKIANGVRAYSTFLGGSGLDAAYSIAVESNGKTYITGETDSTGSTTGYPVKNAYDTSYNGGVDAFITKIDPSISGTNSLVYSSYFGGSAYDVGWGIALNGSTAYIAGETGSSNFPKKNAYDSTYNGVEAFAARFNPSTSGASSLVNSTYLGGTSTDVGDDISVDTSGNVYVSGSTFSSDFPMTGGFDTTYGGGGYRDAFVAKLTIPSSGNSSLTYSTFVGGSGDESDTAIKVGTNGKVFIAAYSESTNLPLFRAFDSSIGGYSDIISAGINTSVTGNNSWLYSTYIGGSSWEQFPDIGVEGASFVTITGHTSSSDLTGPRNAAPMSATKGPYADGFVLKLYVPFDPSNPNNVPTASTFVRFSAFLGGNSNDMPTSVAVDSSGRIYVGGNTYSSDFPMVNAQQPTLANAGGVLDGFVSKMFPEQWDDQLPFCRWPHTAGSTTTLNYAYTSDPDLATGQPWRNAYVQALANWNAAAINIDFTQNAGGTLHVTLGLTNEPLENFAAHTFINCTGTTTTSTVVEGNKPKGVSAGVLTHELGHAQSLNHPASATLSILGTNPDAAGNGTSTPTGAHSQHSCPRAQ